MQRYYLCLLCPSSLNTLLLRGRLFLGNVTLRNAVPLLSTVLCQRKIPDVRSKSVSDIQPHTQQFMSAMPSSQSDHKRFLSLQSTESSMSADFIYKMLRQNQNFRKLYPVRTKINKIQKQKAWIIVVFVKLIFTHLVKKISVVYGYRSFVTAYA